jgi:hypothetical protein
MAAGPGIDAKNNQTIFSTEASSPVAADRGRRDRLAPRLREWSPQWRCRVYCRSWSSRCSAWGQSESCLAADLVGYSRLMGFDDVGALAALKAHRHEVVDPAIAEHDGRETHSVRRVSIHRQQIKHDNGSEAEDNGKNPDRP